MKARRAVLAAAALALASTATASGVAARPSRAAHGPTGDAQAIAFARQVQHAYAALRGVRMVDHDYIFAERDGNGFDYAFGRPRPSGFEPAVGRTDFVLAHDKIVGYLDRVSVRGGGRFSILVDGAGIYVSNSSGCWHPNAASARPYGRLGSEFDSLSSNTYSPLRHRGRLVLLTLTFPWGGGKATATEVDTVDPSTHRILSVHNVVRGTSTFSFSYRLTTLVSAPRLPAPTPVC